MKDELPIDVSTIEELEAKVAPDGGERYYL